MKRAVFIFFTILLSAPLAVFACSLQTNLPIHDDPARLFYFDKTPPHLREKARSSSYIFIGEVVGIVKSAPRHPEDDPAGVEGLKIKVTGSLNAPQPAIYYEVFPLQMDTACILYGQTGLEKFFPVGSEVRVAAPVATVYRNESSENSLIRLEVSYKNGGILVRNDLDEKFRSRVDTYFDYTDFSLANPKTADEERIYGLKLSLLEFELQKDFTFLAASRSQLERISILRRLVDYPLLHAFPFKITAYSYLEPGEELNNLVKKWEQRLTDTARR